MGFNPKAPNFLVSLNDNNNNSYNKNNNNNNSLNNNSNHLWGAKHCTKHFQCIILFNLHNMHEVLVLFLFIKEETKAESIE